MLLPIIESRYLNQPDKETTFSLNSRKRGMKAEEHGPLRPLARKREVRTPYDLICYALLQVVGQNS